MDTIDNVVIGAGVIGLAIARALATRGEEVVVIDRNSRIGEETSSRNSEVIHAGLYYPTESLKAALCVEGKHLLYEYAAKKQIAHNRIGKVIVAVSDSENERLEQIAAQAASNGVDDIEWLDAAELHTYEPNVVGRAGLWSPSTGIIDSHELMLALQGDVEEGAGFVALNTTFMRASPATGGIEIVTDSDGQESSLLARRTINAAGLSASWVANQLPRSPGFDVPQTLFARGSYFTLTGKSPFTHLVYPIPVSGGLGVHATLDLAGRVRFGPDVEWIDTPDYDFDPARSDSFYGAIREYWPALPDGSLQPAYSGIRPKISGPDEPPADFRIEVDELAVGGQTVHLFGIESPGLTSSIAIANHVLSLI